MSEVFSGRSLLYWWGVFSATVFIRDWLRQLADFFKLSNTFTPTKIPFNVLPGLNSWIDGATEFVRNGIQFKPNAPLIVIGTFGIPSWTIAILFGLILIAIAAVLYKRALDSPAWFDDFFALFVFYIVLRMVGHIVGLSGLPVIDALKALADNPVTAYAVMMILMLFLSFFGEGLHSKRAFWRALIEACLLSLFIFPQETSIVLGYVVEALAQFGLGLSQPANLPFAVMWGLIGMLLALNRLISQETSGGGHGGGGGGAPRARAKAD